MALFAEQIRAARAILRMDQAELAKRAGVSVETIKRLEGMEGEVSASPETVQLIEDALNAAGIELIEPGDDSSGAGGGGGVRVIADEAGLNMIRLIEIFEGSVISIVYEAHKKKPEVFKRSEAEMIDAVLNQFMKNREGFCKALKQRVFRSAGARKRAAPDGAGRRRAPR